MTRTRLALTDANRALSQSHQYYLGVTMEPSRDNDLSPKAVGWIVAVIGFVGSFLVPILTYVPWMLATHVTGETGKPGNATVLVGLFLLALQWAAVGYIAAMICVRMSQ